VHNRQAKVEGTPKTLKSSAITSSNPLLGNEIDQLFEESKNHLPNYDSHFENQPQEVELLGLKLDNIALKLQKAQQLTNQRYAVCHEKLDLLR